MSPRPKKTPAAVAPKGRPIRRSQPRTVTVPRDASVPDYSRTPLDAIPLAGLPPRALIAPNFRLYELSKSDLAARLGIDNGFASEAHLRAAKARTIDALWKAVGNICDLYSPDECQNYLKHAGYVAD